MEHQFALYGPLAARFVRVCIACGQHMLGRSYRTFYGVYVRSNGERVPVCGEPIHTRCPASGSAPREISHDPDWLGETERTAGRRVEAVEKGISRIVRTGQYEARFNKKRLGVFETLEDARNARAVRENALKTITGQTETIGEAA